MVLVGALERLPPRTRAAVVLRYYADLPVTDIATVIGTSVNTVKSQLHDALARLREFVDTVAGTVGYHAGRFAGFVPAASFETAR